MVLVGVVSVDTASLEAFSTVVLAGATSVLVMRLALVSRLLSETTFSGLLTAVVSGLTSSAPTFKTTGIPKINLRLYFNLIF